MFRVSVLLINTIFLIWLLFMTVKDMPDDSEEIVFVALFYIVAISNISFAYLSSGSKNGSKSWLGLYFQRKRLEEQKKIESLTQETKNL